MIPNTVSMIYYTLNQKSIDGTSVMTLRLEIMINICSEKFEQRVSALITGQLTIETKQYPVKYLTKSVCFIHL